jgi:outer membrane protein assembly factor BamB/N-acetylneuraminic acid mutarotase
MKRIILIIILMVSIAILINAQSPWTQKADFGGNARVAAIGFSIGDKGYIGTGYDGSNLNDFWEYDPQINIWTQKTGFGENDSSLTNTSITARHAAIGFSIGDKGYIGTGYDESNLNDFWEYDPQINTWIKKADFGGTGRHAAVGFSIGDKGYIGTGSGSSSYSIDFWEYDPQTDAWTQKADFGGTGRHAAVGFSIGDKGYIGTGVNNMNNLDDFWEYDPLTNEWTQKADFRGIGRQYAVGFSIGNKGYIGTGYDGKSDASRLNDFWEYDPQTNIWIQKTDFGGTGRFSAIGFSINDLAYLGTGRIEFGHEGMRKDFWEYNPNIEPPGALPKIVTPTLPEDYLLVPDESLNISWKTTGPEIYMYHLEISNDSDFTSFVVNSAVFDTTFNFTGLDYYQKYYWRVKAENAFGEGPFSEARSFIAVPTNVKTSGEIVSGVSQFDENIYFTSSKDDRIYSFDKSGNLLWTVETGGEIRSTVSVDRDGNVYVGSTDTRLYSFDKFGVPRWDRAMGGTIVSSPSIGPDGTVYVGISTGRFFAISQNDGAILWNIQTGGKIASSASIDSDGTVYFGSHDGKLYAVSNDGNLLWTFQTGSPIVASSALTITGEVLITSLDGKLYKVDAFGNNVWEFTTEDSIVSSPVIGADGIIYFGSSDGTIYAVDKDGQNVWDYYVGAAVNGIPALDRNGSLLIGIDDGRFVVLDRNGELVWYVQTGGSIVAPPLITEENKLFISSTDGYVYILNYHDESVLGKNVFNSDEATQEWPTFKGNNRRTGYQGDVVLSLDKHIDTLPIKFKLRQNYPNPFNPSTTISFALPEQAQVTLEVYNTIGQRIRTIVASDVYNVGYHTAIWDGRDQYGNPVPSGVYIYRLHAGEYVESRKLLLLK